MKKAIETLIIICISLLLFNIIFLTIKGIINFYAPNLLTGLIMINMIVGIAIFLLLTILIYIHRKNLRSLGINFLITFSILAGFYTLFKYIQDVDLLTGLLSLSFGVWAIIWTLNARSVLSKGSLIKNYTTYFFFCLLFVLILTVWDTSVILFDIKEPLKHLKFLFIILIYTTFVFTSYKIYRIGREFGFEIQASKIKKRMKKNNRKKRKLKVK